MTHASEPTTLLAAADEAAGAGDFQSAERLLRDALAAQEARLGRLHPDLVETLNNLAVACERQQKTSDAERGYRRAHAIAVASLKPGNPVIAASLKNLVEFCEAHGVPLWTPPAAKRAAERVDETPLAPAASPAPEQETPVAAAPHVAPGIEIETVPLARAAAAMPPRWVAAALVLGVGVMAVLWFLGPWRPSVSEVSALAEPRSEPSPAPVPAPEPEARPAPAPERASIPIDMPAAPRAESPGERDARAKAAPVETARPPAAGATHAVGVLTAAVCADFDRRGSPDWQCTPISGSAPPGTFTFYTRLRSGAATTVEHRWYHGGSLHMRVTLRVGAGGASGYRTYSRATIAREKAGDWKVELRASDGTILREERFVVR